MMFVESVPLLMWCGSKLQHFLALGHGQVHRFIDTTISVGDPLFYQFVTAKQQASNALSQKPINRVCAVVSRDKCFS